MIIFFHHLKNTVKNTVFFHHYALLHSLFQSIQEGNEGRKKPLWVACLIVIVRLRIGALAYALEQFPRGYAVSLGYVRRGQEYIIFLVHPAAFLFNVLRRDQAAVFVQQLAQLVDAQRDFLQVAAG